MWALEARARRGDVEAQLELGRHYEALNNAMAARAWFAQAAKAGSAGALRSLAIHLLTRDPVEAEKGINMMRAAADRGDAEATLVCANLAASDVNLPDRWNVATECLRIAAQRGSSLAREQLEFLESAKPDFTDLVRPQRVIFDAPRVAVIEGCASHAECDWLIARARPDLMPALVYNTVQGAGMVGSTRSNSSVGFNVAQSDIVFMLLRARIEAITGIAHLRLSNVLHYSPGQEFKPHFDFLDPAQPGYAHDLETKGQRIATFLVYLNDDYEGGETDFPELDWRYKGRKGDALLFWNVDTAGLPDPRTLHAGLPPTKGEKWVFSQWLWQPLHAATDRGARS
jgi:prolyl 4-hydroxylase